MNWSPIEQATANKLIQIDDSASIFFDGNERDLIFKNRIYNPSIVLRHLKNKFPHNDYSGVEAYVYICFALANHYVIQARDRVHMHPESERLRKEYEETQEYFQHSMENFELWMTQLPGDRISLPHLSKCLCYLLNPASN